MPPTRPSPRLVSVVVPVRDAAGTLPDLLDALAAQDHAGAVEVVLADNGSTDGSAEIAERWLRGRSGRLVRADERRSASHARNAGAAHAGGDFLAFTDADDVPRSGWLSGLTEAARHGDLVAGEVDVDGLSDEITRSWHPASPRQRALESFGFLTYASGTNTGVWADVFERLGGFDEDTVVGEDIEFSWRAQLAGYSVAWAPEAVVQESLRRGLPTAARQHYRYGTAGPHLYRRFRADGMRRAALRDGLRTWSRIVGTAPAAAWSRRRRGRWALETALAAGRVAGCVRERVLFP